MKKIIHLLLLSVLFFAVFGCATPDGEKVDIRLIPPDEFNPIYLRYKELPGEKIMVISIDTEGQWAFGYDYNRDTLKEAAETAAIKCDKARKKFMVRTPAKLFAVNDDIVYYDCLFK